MRRYRMALVWILLVLVFLIGYQVRTMQYERDALKAVASKVADLVQLEVEGPYLEFFSPRATCDGEVFPHFTEDGTEYWVKCYVNAYDQSLLDRLKLDYIEQVGIVLYRTHEDAVSNRSRIGDADLHFDRSGAVISQSF